jgi:acyl-CoA thioester hydrolase
VQYGIALFKMGETVASAHGHFVHVFVERAVNKPIPVPPDLRRALEMILV